MYKFIVNLHPWVAMLKRQAADGKMHPNEMLDYEHVELTDVFTIQVSGQIVK